MAKSRVSPSCFRGFPKKAWTVSFKPTKLTKRTAFSILKYWSPSVFCMMKGSMCSFSRCLIVRYFISSASRASSSWSSRVLKKLFSLPPASYITRGKFIMTVSTLPVCMVSSSQSSLQSDASLKPVEV